MSNNDELEQAISKQLTEGDMDGVQPEEEAVDRLPPKYVVLIRMETDPIVEETKEYRRMAQEVDARYDRFLKKSEDGTC